MDLRGKIAVVTGAARGIGRGIAVAIARAGCDVAVADLLSADAALAAGAEETARDVAEHGRRALLVDCDVASEAACDALVARALDELGGLHVVVANAGIAGVGDVASTPLAQWERVLRVNATGVFLTCRAALPHLAAQGEGAIVNVASVLGLRASADRVAYSASKFAVVGLTQALAAELAPRGVRVNCICPSSVRSGMTIDELKAHTGVEDDAHADALWTKVAAKRLPFGRSVEPDDIGRAAVWLCESDMVSGVALPVTGGDGLVS
ncbi:MAG: SDR family NAD(P)-dependent oxidoreductase [Myxococcota bacterium]